KKPLFPARGAQISPHKQYLAAKLAPSISWWKKAKKVFFCTFRTDWHCKSPFSAADTTFPCKGSRKSSM
ncbi:MAG: hypothetical protein J6X67_01945, partial [Treponema sp.]|nr:hypothetical protein [Treponema sp.]